jgi:hypothetical protein
MCDYGREASEDQSGWNRKGRYQCLLPIWAGRLTSLTLIGPFPPRVKRTG